MKQRLILHIGLPKTGTTAIQDFLAINKTELARQGVSYVPGRIFENWKKLGAYEKTLGLIEEQVGKGNDIVVSDEAICTYLAEHPESTLLQERFPSLQIQVVIYLRRQDLHIESLYNYMRTNRNIGHFEWQEFPRKFKPLGLVACELYDYYAWLSPLADLLGKENVCVREYDFAKFKGGSIFPDFMDAIGKEYNSALQDPPRKANLSLDQRYADLAVKQYETFPGMTSVQGATSVRALIALNQTMGMTKNRTMFTPEQREQFLESFKQSNEMVAETFLGGSTLFSYDDLLTPRENDTFTEDELLLMPVVLNKIWYDAVYAMPYGVFNAMKMKELQCRANNGDTSARKYYHIRKIINSVGKRLFPKQFPTLKMAFQAQDVPEKE